MSNLEILQVDTDNTLIVEPGEIEVVEDTNGDVIVSEAQEIQIIASAEQGPAGPPGIGGFISADADNRATYGGDGGIYTPDMLVDPLAYYILAKS